MSNSIYPTLSRAVEGFFIEKRGQGRSEDTIHDYNNGLTHLKRFLGCDPHINELTSRQMTEFFHYLDQYEYTRGKTFRKLAPKTVFNVQKFLSSFFSWIDEEYQFEMPKLPSRTAKEAPVLPFSEDEVVMILKACDYTTVETTNRIGFKMTRRTRLRDKAIILMLFDTGVRSTELCNMRFADLDVENSRITITGKGKKKRIIYFGRNTARHLWKYHSTRFPKDPPLSEDYLFVDDDGFRPMNRDSLRQLFRRLGEKADVKDVHPHRFRHTFAVQFLRNGGSVFHLQDLLGHTSLKMCRRYVNLAENDLMLIHRKAGPGDALLRR